MESPCVSPCSLIGPNLPSANQSGSKLTNKVLVRFISEGTGGVKGTACVPYIPRARVVLRY